MNSKISSKKVTIRQGVPLDIAVSAALAFEKTHVLAPEPLGTGEYNGRAYTGDSDGEVFSVIVYHTKTSIVVKLGITDDEEEEKAE